MPTTATSEGGAVCLSCSGVKLLFKLAAIDDYNKSTLNASNY